MNIASRYVIIEFPDAKGDSLVPNRSKGGTRTVTSSSCSDYSRFWRLNPFRDFTPRCDENITLSPLNNLWQLEVKLLWVYPSLNWHRQLPHALFLLISWVSKWRWRSQKHILLSSTSDSSSNAPVPYNEVLLVSGTLLYIMKYFCHKEYLQYGA